MMHVNLKLEFNLIWKIHTGSLKSQKDLIYWKFWANVMAQLQLDRYQSGYMK